MTADQAELLQKARQRDPAALTHIYDTYAPKIYAYIYRHVGSPQRAEDITSVTFLKMLEALDRGRFARDSLQSWLYRIAYNAIVDDARRRKRRPISTLHEGISMPPDTLPEHIVGRRVEREQLLQAVQQLSADQRHVIILRFGDGLTAPEVGQILGKTEEAVRALQRRGLANLRKILSSTSPVSSHPATVVSSSKS
ncbi:MAG: sigma-70 family RNA polymerase sigma factor [Chloroflexi bacterium]|nr:sigma-70 family RNA polymerase sigma factor [Chloroflexota bacterium]